MKYEAVYDKLQQAHIAYSNENSVRHLSTAGGYISTLIEYLFISNEISTAITFERDGIVFSPKLIYSYDEYNNVGSLYQEIDIIGFLKNNINNIKGKMAVTVLPCQVNAVRFLAKKHNIEVFIISLVCSAQMNISCTEQYLKLIKVKKDEIIDFRYRGRGWPKYISIGLNDNSIIEEKELWNQMFHSYFFHEKRCLKCSDTFGVKSDIAISDPWLGAAIKEERIGKSIVYIFSDDGLNIHNNVVKSNLIKDEPIDSLVAINSQLYTMQKKYFFRKNPRLRKIVKYFNFQLYRKIIFSNKHLMKLHSKIINKIIFIIISKKKKEN